ncbi:uncharacterized protein A4U43_C07F10860 [Asparagus officinalis]|uniref:Uncharacterized protein n=1 Tax=Asparagus officinalis TaxID=4686 RepID=A0A5P1ECW6_ASPOF|nr:acyl transferase 5-like [Asparagus officinalis]ONK63047.1 uncharacterized protein A4U43_C07F10860 [Asparagus officinalis]
MTLSVSTLSQSFVKPSDPTPAETLNLSAIDRVPGLRHMVRSLHVFKHGQNPCEVIREALAKALVHYYPFAGRFVELEGGEVAIDCNGEGAWFVEAKASCSLEDVKYMDYPLVMSKEELLPQASPEFDPLDVPVMLKVTEFTCGGFVVGLISIHTIADGLGAAQFIRAIGDLARGPKPAVNPPILSRDLIPTPPQLPPSPPLVFPSFKLVSFVTDLHPDYISKIKASYFETTGEHCSAFDISTAKAWQARTRAINLDRETPVSVCFFANTRHLLTQEGGFYGNCFYPVTVTATSGVVTSVKILDVVQIVRDAKARLPMEFGRWGRGEFEEDPYTLKFTYDSLFVSDWSRLGFREVDFGWGMPANVVPFSYVDFMAVAIFGAPPVPKKGMRVMTKCVEEEHLQVFQQEMKNLV